MENMKKLLGIFVLLFFLTACSTSDIKDIKEIADTISDLQEKPTSEITGPYQVTKVVDGDTIKVKIDGQEKTVRMIGIDTPETVDPNKEVQCYGPEASDFAKFSMEEKTVYLETDSTQGDVDKYGRILRYVHINNGPGNAVLYNQLVVQEGYAKEYLYDKEYKYRSVFLDSEKNARENNKGLWGACNA